jgi:hypothetical protein
MLTNDLYLKDHDSIGHIFTTISGQLVISHMGESNPCSIMTFSIRKDIICLDQLVIIYTEVIHDLNSRLLQPI